jgi:hypothetical protein
MTKKKSKRKRVKIRRRLPSSSSSSSPSSRSSTDAAADEGARAAVLLRALWASRAFRESFLDSHKESAVGGQRRQRKRVRQGRRLDRRGLYGSAGTMRVYRMFAGVFSSIERFDATTMNNGGGGGGPAAAALSATSSFSFLRFLVSGFVAWSNGPTKKQFGDQVRLHVAFRSRGAPRSKLFLRSATSDTTLDDSEDAKLTVKRLEKMLKRHAKWLERADRTDSSKSPASSSRSSRGLLAHLSEFDLVVSPAEVGQREGSEDGPNNNDVDDANDDDNAGVNASPSRPPPTSIRIPLSDLLSCKWRQWKGAPSETSSLGRYFERRGGSSRVCIHTRLTYGQGVKTAIDIVLPDSHASMATSSSARTEGLNSFVGHDFCDFVDQESSLPCPVTISRGFQELLHPSTAHADGRKDDVDDPSRAPPRLCIAPLKGALPRSYASMDLRHVTAGLFFDILHLLCRAEEDDGDGDNGDGTSESASNPVHKRATSLLKSTDAGVQFVDERKTATRHSPSNVFRHDTVVEWPGQKGMVAGGAATTTQSSSAGLLPAGCFRFWHPVSVEAFVFMHEQCVLGIAPDEILQRFVNEGVSLGIRIKEDEEDEEDKEGAKGAEGNEEGGDSQKEDKGDAEVEENNTVGGGNSNSPEENKMQSKGNKQASDIGVETDSDDGREAGEDSLHPDHNERFEDRDSDGDAAEPLLLPSEDAPFKAHGKTPATDIVQEGLGHDCDLPVPTASITDQTFSCFQGRSSNTERAEGGASEAGENSDAPTRPAPAGWRRATSDRASDVDSVIRDEGMGESPPFATMLRKLLETRAFISLGYQRASAVIQASGHSDVRSRPSLRLEARPAVFCVRLEWPSCNAIRSPRLGSQAVALVWSTLRRSNGRLDLYDVFDAVGGKARDGRDPENIRACRCRLLQVICFVGHDASGVYRFERKESAVQNRSEDDGAENGTWALYDGSGQVRVGLRWEDMQALCREQRGFPELLFFESLGPSARDIRLRERHERVTASDLMLAPALSTHGVSDGGLSGSEYESSAFRDRLFKPVVHGYGTIEREATSSNPVASMAGYSLDELEPNWCNGPCMIQ